MPKKSLKSPSLEITVKLAILHTIANTIYPSTARKIREAAANAIDNRASWFIIHADRETSTLSLFDNGNGITKGRFREIFNNLGVGLLKGGPEDRLSYFGLGLVSIFRLGKKAKIFTKPHGEENTLCLDVDTEKIFDTKIESKPIGFLSQCIKLSNDGDAKRLASPAPSMEKHVKDLFGTVPHTYTEIVIEQVYSEDFDQITDTSFEIELRQLLPLAPDDKDPFLLRIKDPRKLGDLKKIFENRKYFPTLDVWLGIAEEKPLTRLRKYFPEFKEELEYKEADIEVGTSPSKEFKYYIIHTTQDLERYGKAGSETGFWVRNQNFLVKAADFFEKPGSKKKYVHEPIKNWMYGEIFHRNMNDFLTVARNDYIWESQKSLAFMAETTEIVHDLNLKLRKVWKQKRGVINAIVEPIELLYDPKGPIYRCNETLEKMGVRADGKDAQIIIDKLHKCRKPELEDDAKRVDHIFEKKLVKPITLADKEEVIVQIDPIVPPGEFYQDIWDPDNQKTNISISPKLFDPKEVIFLGKTFTVYFVIAKETESAISVNKDRAAIYINPFNIDLKNYTVSFIDIYIAIEIADVMASTKEEMKNYLLKLLGRNFPSVAEYFGPLGDDLMRKRHTK